jgi:peptide/nickel transport system permease protein
LTADALDTGLEIGRRPGWLALHRLARRRAALFGLAVVVFFVALALAAPFIAPYDPLATDWHLVRKPPSLQHLFGTDDLGRDVLARVIWGARASLMAGIVSVGIALTVAVPLGLLSGYLGGFIDGVLMRIIDAMLAIPFLVLAIALAAFLGPSLINAMIAIGIVQTPIFTRLTRSQALAVKLEDYIEAAHAVGNPHHRILLRHILPNIAAPILVQATLAIAARSSPRQAYRFSASANSRRHRAGAACSIPPVTSSRRRHGWRCGRASQSSVWWCRSTY